MQIQSNTELVGFVQLQVGSMAVQVPVHQEKTEVLSALATPLATFEAEGDSYMIVIHGSSSTREVEQAVGEAAKDALVHLSRKLLN